MSGIGAIDTQHPLSLGLLSRGGAYQANGAARQADVLLALGVRFDDRTSSSWIPGYSFTIPPTKLIHVDIDPDEIGRNYPVALGLMADVRTFLRQVLAELETRKGVADAAASRKKWLATIDGYAPGVEQVHRAGLHRRLDADPSAARRRRDRQGAARRRHHGQRHRRASQLAPAVLQAEAAGQLHRLHGLRLDGLRRRRRARREVRGARPALRLGVRRRRVLHARQRARHRGRIQSAGRLGGLEQLRLCVDPRLAARLSRRPRARHRLPSSGDRQAVQSGLRRDGALGRRRGRARRPRRRHRQRDPHGASPPTSRT